jgi:hypothetical protein
MGLIYHGQSTFVIDIPCYQGDSVVVNTGYTKLFKNIIYSTIWQEPLEVKVVWITMLALKDRDGKVFCSVPGLAKAAGVTVEQAVAALEKFKQPDPFSTTKENEGRRIEEIDGGWFILNHYKYQEAMSVEDRRAYWALKQREARARKHAMSRKIRQRERETMLRAGGEEGAGT